jgi:hypothetical protein
MVRKYQIIVFDSFELMNVTPLSTSKSLAIGERFAGPKGN